MNNDDLKWSYIAGTVRPREGWIEGFDRSETYQQLHSWFSGYGVPYITFLEYDKALEKWPKPKLTPTFRRRFPNFSQKLDETWKVRAIFRIAESLELNLNDIGIAAEKMLDWIHSKKTKDTPRIASAIGESWSETALRLLSLQSLNVQCLSCRRFVDLVFPKGTIISCALDNIISIKVAADFRKRERKYLQMV